MHVRREVGKRTHEQQEEGEAGIESWLLETKRIARLAHLAGCFGGIRHVRTVRVVKGLQCCAEGEPEGAEGAEDDEGKGVADDPFAD